MNGTINPDAPAFPSRSIASCDVDPDEVFRGLTIRAEFARSALQGIASALHGLVDYHPDAVSVDRYAELAVRLADALIAELNKRS